MNKKYKAFTLIELLVVIAIIGILASVVLSSLNSARVKAKDASTKSTLNNLRSELALYYDTYKSYRDVCTAGSVRNILDDLAQKNSTSVLVYSSDERNGGIFCRSNPQDWTISSKLQQGINQFYCIDSFGRATTGSFAAYQEQNGCTTPFWEHNS